MLENFIIMHGIFNATIFSCMKLFVRAMQKKPPKFDVSDITLTNEMFFRQVAASQLLSQGKEVPVRFWHDQMFAKPAQHGGVVAW